MAFRYRKVYVNVLTFGLFWASFHYYYGRGLESVMSLLDSARQVQSSNRQEWKTNYPWIGDPDCQHLPVQVLNHFEILESQESLLDKYM